MATRAEKLPSGNWRVRVQYMDGGRRHYKSFTAKTRKEAEYRAALFALANINDKAAGKDMTVGQALAAFIDARSAVLSPSTIRAYRSIERTHLQSLRAIRLSELDQSAIQSAINQAAVHASPKTVRNICALLTSAVHAACPDKRIRADLPKKVHTEITIPTENTIARLLGASAGTILQSAILLAAGYGLRRGEIAALSFADIDEDACTLHIHKALAHAPGGEWVEKPPKSYAGNRTLQVSPKLISALRANSEGGERVCPISPNTITDRFAALCRRTGVHCRFHDLRHYNASVMLALSVPDKYAMERLGQSTPGMIKTVYQHIINEKRNEISDTMDATFNSLLGKM